MALREWVQRSRSDHYILQGVRLAEARSLAERNDVGLRDPDGWAFLEQSEEEDARELRQARRRQWILAGAASVAALFAVAALVAAFLATEQQRLATSRELASSAIAQLTVDPELSVLLATQAMSTSRTSEAEDALRQSLRGSRVRFTVRPSGGVRAAVLSSDGQRVVGVGSDGTVGVWDVRGNGEPIVLRGDTDQVTTASFSPDGQRVATASKDGSARVWDAISGTGLLQLEHAAAVQSVAFDASGMQLLTRSADGVTRIWDLVSHTELKRFVALTRPKPERQTNARAGAQFASGGSRILAADNQGLVWVWDRETGVELVEQELGMVFSPDGARVVSGGSNADWGTLHDAATGKIVADLPGDDPAVQEGFLFPVQSLDVVAAFSPDGSSLVTTGANGSLRIWEASTGKSVRVLPGHVGAVLSAAFSPDGQRILTAGSDGTVRIWNATGRGSAIVLRGHTDQVSSASFDSSGRRVLSVSKDGSARVWDLPTQIGDGTSRIVQAIFSPDGTRVVMVNRVGIAQVWDTASGRKLVDTRSPGLIGDGIDACPARLNPIDVPHLGAAFSPSGEYVVTKGPDISVARVWEATTGRVVTTCHVGGFINGVDFSRPDGRYAFLQSLNGAEAWDATTGKQLEFATGVDEVAFSPDGTRVAVVGAAGADIWNMQSGQHTVALVQGTAVHTPRFSPDGTRLAAIADDVAGGPERISGMISDQPGTPRIWDVTTGQQVAALAIPGGLSGELVFSSEGRRLLTMTRDVNDGREARVWDASTGRELTVLRQVNSVAFSPDGARLLAVFQAGTLQLGAPGAMHALASPGTAGSAVTGAMFSPEGTRVLSSHVDGAARLWDVATGVQLDVLRDHVGEVTTASFSPDGMLIVSAGDDGTAQIYGCEVTCSIDGLTTLARSRTTRELTSQERERYLHQS